MVRCNRKYAERSISSWRKQHRIMNYLNKEYEQFRVHPFSFGISRDPRVPRKKERKMDDNAYLLRRRGAFDDVSLAMSSCERLRGYDERPCFIFVRWCNRWGFLPVLPIEWSTPVPGLNYQRALSGKPKDAEGSRRDAALTALVDVDPAVAGYLAPSLLAHPPPPFPAAWFDAQAWPQVRGNSRSLTDTSTHLAKRSKHHHVGATTSDVAGKVRRQVTRRWAERIVRFRGVFHFSPKLGTT